MAWHGKKHIYVKKLLNLHLKIKFESVTYEDKQYPIESGRI